MPVFRTANVSKDMDSLSKIFVSVGFFEEESSIHIYIPGVSGALVNYFGRGVRRPEPWIVAASKGTKVRVCLS